ncbi:MAG: permease [Pseudomonadota bacterium]
MSDASLLVPIATLAALLVGPALWFASRQNHRLGEAIDGFAIVAVGGLTLLLIAPTAVAAGGWIAVVLIVAGMLLPSLLHRLGPRGAGRRADRLLLLALVLHAAFESAALAASAEAAHLGLAIAAHRIPVGLAVFMLAPTQRDGWLAIALIIAASVLGYTGGDQLELLTPAQHAWLDALVAGSLLHVIHGGHLSQSASGCDHHGHGHEHGHGHGHAGQHHGEQASGGLRAGAAVGGLLGAGVLMLALSDPHGHHHASEAEPHVLEQFLELALISAPALLLGYLLAGLVRALLGEKSSRWLNRGSRVLQAGKGITFGLPMPICSCGVLPVYESLVRRGVAPAAAMAFLIATPELGIDALALSVPLLGVELTLWRLGAAAAVALIVALLLAGSVAPAMEAADTPDPQDARPLAERLAGGLHFGLVELFDHTLPWVAVGLLVAAMLAPALSGGLVAGIHPLLQVPLATLVAIPAYVCASGATPIAAVAIAGGLSPGAAIAFLIAGPATNVTTFGILGRLHGRRLALNFGLLMALAAMACGWLINLSTPDLAVPELSAEHHEHGLLQEVCLAVLTLLALASLVRQGPRGMLGQVVAPFRA